jgi:hypothetical protein
MLRMLTPTSIRMSANENYSCGRLSRLRRVRCKCSDVQVRNELSGFSVSERCADNDAEQRAQEAPSPPPRPKATRSYADAEAAGNNADAEAANTNADA